MIPIKRHFTFLTAAFPHGAYQSQGFNQPELRGPSIKGQLRWWFDALLGGSDPRSTAAEDRIFGGLKNPRTGEKPGPEASRIAVRIQCLSGEPGSLATHILPHKPQPGERGPKNAISPGTRYEISLTPRREGPSGQESQHLERILDAWLLLGAVGQRANRAAGSLWPEAAPRTVEAYELQAAKLLAGSKLRCAVLPGSFATDERKLRSFAGDFCDGPTQRIKLGSREVEATEFWWPFGSAEPRKPSLLKLRAALLGEELRLVAVWDGRCQSSDYLRRGVEMLAKQKEIGRMLKPALLRLCQ